MRGAGPVTLTFAAWLVAAAAFAALRVPYDDEWFSLTLATQTGWDQLLWSLGHDVHPPAPALVDRALAAFGAGAFALRLLRLLLSAFALWLVARTLERRWGLAPWMVAVAAFHPILFMYAGAMRWYPYVLLAQALRLWALWGAPVLGRRSGLALVLGATCGPACGYVDLPFALLDAGWYAATAGPQRRGASLAAAALAAGSAALTVLASASLLGQGALFLGAGRGLSPSPSTLARWLLPGLVGEAVLPWPFTPLTAPSLLLLPASLALALPRSRGFGAWIACVAAGWAATTSLSWVWHPRYSLLLWLLATASLFLLWRRGGLARWAAGLAGVSLLVALALTCGQRHFLKADLNRLEAASCPELLPWLDLDLIVAPYPRTAEELRTVCSPACPVVTAPWVRHLAVEADVAVPIARALVGRERVGLVLLRTSSSLSLTNNQVRRAIAERCRLEEGRGAVEPAQLVLRRLLSLPPENPRFSVERWRCDAAGPAVETAGDEDSTTGRAGAPGHTSLGLERQTATEE